MYCPKCGGQNSDDLAYCRECGENLKIISQVMKGHSPVALVSKLDAAIEQKNERLRRDAIYYIVLGLVYTVCTRSFFLSTGEPLFWIFSAYVFPAIVFVSSGWKYLAYRRSLELKKGRNVVSEFATNEDSVVNKIASTSASGSESPLDDSLGNSIYCPACGLRNTDSQQYCKNCGFGLVFGAKGLEKYLPAFILQSLDRTIAKNEEFRTTNRSKTSLFLTPSMMIIAAVMFGLAGNLGLMFWAIFMGLSNVILTGWNLLADRRSNMKDNAVSASHDRAIKDLSQRNAKQLGVSVPDMQDLPAGEQISFGASDKRNLEFARPSVTEETTKHLPMTAKDIDEPVAKTR